MTLSTLDTKQRLLVKNALVFTIVSIVCALIAAIYESFSHGVYSYYMLYAFGFSLAGEVLPSLVLLCMKNPKVPGTYARYFWHSAVAVFSVGSFFRGVLDIYGTTSRLLKPYPAAGVILTVLAVVSAFVKKDTDTE